MPNISLTGGIPTVGISDKFTVKFEKHTQPLAQALETILKNQENIKGRIYKENGSHKVSFTIKEADATGEVLTLGKTITVSDGDSKKEEILELPNNTESENIYWLKGATTTIIGSPGNYSIEVQVLSSPDADPSAEE